MPCTVANAPCRVVQYGTFWVSAVRSSAKESRRAVLLPTVLTTRLMSLSIIRSTALGRPSCTLKMRRTSRPACRIAAAVPSVARTSKPSSMRARTRPTACGLSRSRRLTNALPPCGRELSTLIWDLANALGNDVSRPMASPVDFISGPRTVSTPGNLMNGSTASLTALCGVATSSVKPSSFRVLPAMTRAASLASGTPVALLTNGMVREARGLTSRT